MNIDQASLTPIYMQIAEGLEDEILSGLLRVGDQAYSQNHIAATHGINPATAAKGLSMLVEEKILFRKRGLGMYVTEEAVSIIREKRKARFRDELLTIVVREAVKLGIDLSELKLMIDSIGGAEPDDGSSTS